MAANSSFGKGLAVLGWVLDHEVARADEIAVGLDLPTSSAYRFLRTLREHDLVRQSDGGFVAGPRLDGRAGEPTPRRLVELATPFLEQLTSRTSETAILTVRQGYQALCAAQVESTHAVRLAFRVGQLLPLHAGAGQRVLLAFAPPPVVRHVLAAELPSYTTDTPGPRSLSRALARIRTEGVAISRGELIPHALAMAVPVMRGPEAVAALSVAGPRNRCPKDWQGATRRDLQDAASSLIQVLDPG